MVEVVCTPKISSTGGFLQYLRRYNVEDKSHTCLTIKQMAKMISIAHHNLLVTEHMNISTTSPLTNHPQAWNITKMLLAVHRPGYNCADTAPIPLSDWQYLKHSNESQRPGLSPLMRQ